MKRTVLVVDDEANMQTVMRMGEAEFSPMHLMCIGAAERPHMGESENSQTSSGRLRRRTGAADSCCTLGCKRAGVS
jgi:hypothetical protein